MYILSFYLKNKMYECLACIYACYHLCTMPPEVRGQRSEGVKIVTVVSHHVGSETQTQVLWKSRALIRGAVSVAPFTQLSKRVLEIQLGAS